MDETYEVEIPDGYPHWLKEHIELYLSDPESGQYWDASLGRGAFEGILKTLLLITTRLFEAICSVCLPLRDYPAYAGDRQIPIVVLDSRPGPA